MNRLFRILDQNISDEHYEKTKNIRLEIAIVLLSAWEIVCGCAGEVVVQQKGREKEERRC